MARSAQQYFARRPATPDRRRTIAVTLRGHTVRVVTAAGVFSERRLDPGTAVLLRKAPDPPTSGTFLDLGCGWGPLALALGLQSPAASVWAVDVNLRAVGLCRLNALRLGLKNVHALSGEDLDPGIAFNLIWSNPPVRVGKEALHQLLLSYLPRLCPGGRALLVVQRNLGSDSLARWLSGALPQGFSTKRVASSKGYRLLEVRRVVANSPARAGQTLSVEGSARR